MKTPLLLLLLLPLLALMELLLPAAAALLSLEGVRGVFAPAEFAARVAASICFVSACASRTLRSMAGSFLSAAAALDWSALPFDGVALVEEEEAAADEDAEAASLCLLSSIEFARLMPLPLLLLLRAPNAGGRCALISVMLCLRGAVAAAALLRE